MKRKLQKLRRGLCGSLSAALALSMAAAGPACAANGGFSIALSEDDEAWKDVAMANDDKVSTGIVIRTGMDSESPAAGYLYRGGAVKVMGEENGWTEVRSGNVSGYVRSEYLTFGTQAKGLAEYYGEYGVKASWDDVKVFAADDKDASIVGTANDGDTYPIVQNNGHWLQVRTGKEETAYVSSEDTDLVILVDSAYSVREEDDAQEQVENRIPAQKQEVRESISDAEPAQEETTYEEPAYEEPAYEEPAQEETTYEEPAYEEPAYEEPAQEEPAYEEPAYEGPVYEEPAQEEPAYQEPAYEEPVYEEPAQEEPTYEEPTYEEPVQETSEDTASYDVVYEEEASYTEDPAYTEEGSYTEEASDPGESSSSSDVDLLAAIIYHEAGNQPEEGKIAVGAVVLNRVNSSSFPGTISEVLYQPGQFTPAGELASTIANGVPSDCYSAAYAALAGQDPTGGCLYFNTSHGSGIQIGAHWFY